MIVERTPYGWKVKPENEPIGGGSFMSLSFDSIEESMRQRGVIRNHERIGLIELEPHGLKIRIDSD